MVFLSIVIPTYNSQKTILPLLTSIASSQKVDFGEIEIVVVDDCSTDKSVEKVKEFFLSKDNKSLTLKNSYPATAGGESTGRELLKGLKIISLKRNSGPAHARNVGTKYAKGKVVLFLDSDVLVYRNTLFEVIKSFKSDRDLYALTGVWDKKQKNRKFFPKFKALRDWSYWINERDPRNYYYLFSTRVAAIDRALFLRLGGFDETYKAALVEDIELTYRIARRYAVVFNPKVIVAHEFEDFIPIAKKYFWRSFYWSRIYRERKKFDPVATTPKEAVTTISAGMLVGLGLAGILSHLGYLRDLGYLSEIRKWIAIAGAVAFLVHLWGVRKFLWFTAKEEGIYFAIRAFFTGILLYLVILAGAAVSVLPGFVVAIPILERKV